MESVDPTKIAMAAFKGADKKNAEKKTQDMLHGFSFISKGDNGTMFDALSVIFLLVANVNVIYCLYVTFQKIPDRFPGYRRHRYRRLHPPQGSRDPRQRGWLREAALHGLRR